MHTSSTQTKKLPIRLFNLALVAAHIPSDLQDKWNETSGLWKFLLKPMENQLFASCLAKCSETLNKTQISLPEFYSAEYNEYRKQLGVVFNHPMMVQGHLNYLATGWRGDPYALVQRQTDVAKTS